jgi:ferric-chelate reductase (NADPH)
MMLKLFTRQARVESVEAINPKFSVITLQGDALKDVAWTPGDKIQMQFGGWVQRTYTPLDWDAASGRTRMLVYLHADTPGVQWARAVQAGDGCVLFGPRRSIDLRRLRQPCLFFGDETSFGLALALRSTAADIEGMAFLFEVSTPLESRHVLNQFLGMPQADCLMRHDSEAGSRELLDKMQAVIAAHRPEQIVLTGRSTAVQQLHRAARQQGFSASQLLTKAYWAPGKTGLD